MGPQAIEFIIPANGTAVALNKQRMKSVGEKNEIAGTATQKLPSASERDDEESQVLAEFNPQPDIDLSKPAKGLFYGGSFVYLTNDSVLPSDLQAKWAQKIESGDTAALQAERVARLMFREVLTMRQCGANSLAVSLRVDSQTELFLRLTNHNGIIQARLRCERGSLEGLASHWGELQESLARQNVQLMPLEDSISFPQGATTNAQSGNPSAGAFDPSRQKGQRQLHDPAVKPPSAAVAPAGPAASKAENNNRSQQGWETWA